MLLDCGWGEISPPLQLALTTPLARLLFTHANKFWHQRIDGTLHILMCVYIYIACVCVCVCVLSYI